MKKLLLLGLLTIACNCVFANIKQGNWRWRADNGSETSATWLAAENTAPTITSMDNVRLRVELDDTIPNWTFNKEIFLMYSKDQTTWDSVSQNSSRDWMMAGSSPFVTDMESTTQQLAGTALGSIYTFVPGMILVSSTLADTSYTLDSAEKTEIEWVIKPTATTASNTTYYFRVGDGSVDYPTTVISLLTGATLPISLSSFTVSADGKCVKVMWTTASEQNNDRFEIQRSANGRDNWQVVATQKGSGTTTQSHTYTAYDEHPLNGINYYRIKQYDFDGKSKESEVRSLTMQLVKALIAAYPSTLR